MATSHAKDKGRLLNGLIVLPGGTRLTTLTLMLTPVNYSNRDVNYGSKSAMSRGKCILLLFRAIHAQIRDFLWAGRDISADGRMSAINASRRVRWATPFPASFEGINELTQHLGCRSTATVDTCAPDVRRANLSAKTFEEFRDSLQRDGPPEGLSPALAGL